MAWPKTLIVTLDAASVSCCPFHFFILYLTVWGVEPVVTHQTSWLESTGVCGVHTGHLAHLSALSQSTGAQPLHSSTAPVREHPPKGLQS